MSVASIAVIESQKRSAQAEFLRWSKILEDTTKELEITAAEDPKRSYLVQFTEDCRVMVEHYKSIGDVQEKTLGNLRD